MGKLILLRHGQSIWNKKNLFTGWVDIPLSDQGVQEALSAGEKIADISIDVVFVSGLIRAQMTAMLALSRHSSQKTPCMMHEDDGRQNWFSIYDHQTEKECIPVYITPSLNERMYGKLQGVNKDIARKQYGQERIELWRRSLKEAPPLGESLQMTADRVMPYFKKNIISFLGQNKTVLVVAHGNSLRAIVMYIENIPEKDVAHLEIATGSFLMYGFNQGEWEKKHDLS